MYDQKGSIAEVTSYGLAKLTWVIIKSLSQIWSPYVRVKLCLVWLKGIYHRCYDRMFLRNFGTNDQRGLSQIWCCTFFCNCGMNGQSRFSQIWLSYVLVKLWDEMSKSVLANLTVICSCKTLAWTANRVYHRFDRRMFLLWKHTPCAGWSPDFPTEWINGPILLLSCVQRCGNFRRKDLQFVCIVSAKSLILMHCMDQLLD